LGDIFQKKMRPTPKKYCPNGEISPNLVTLISSSYGFWDLLANSPPSFAVIVEI
jgi:hypothetical protein